MNNCTRLVPEIVQSSIWSEPCEVRVVWITMLAIKDNDGYVRGDENTLSRIANVPVDAVKTALDKFQSPDPSSHTQAHEGRRVKRSGGGWVILNHHIYKPKSEKRQKEAADMTHAAMADAGVVPQALNNADFARAWDLWVEYRNAKKKPLSMASVKMQMKKLASMGCALAVESIEQSIQNDWQGLFDVRRNQSYSVPKQEQRSRYTSL